MITIYTKPFCPFCSRAKHLLTAKGAAFNEIDISMVSGARNEMIERSGGGTTVPQIFIGQTHVGGCDDLHDLEDKGELDALLSDQGAG